LTYLNICDYIQIKFFLVITYDPNHQPKRKHPMLEIHKKTAEIKAATLAFIKGEVKKTLW